MRVIFLIAVALLLMVLAAEPTFAQVTGPGFNPLKAQRAYAFIDGSNLFFKLREAGIRLTNLYEVIRQAVYPRELVRAYLYTIEDRFKKAQQEHGQDFYKNIRVEFGITVLSHKKGVKEKAVDAMLVADLIYHAAQKNCDYALILAYDQDYIRAIKRVEDFGCRTSVLALCEDAPVSLQEVCDKYVFRDSQYLISNKWAKPNVSP